MLLLSFSAALAAALSLVLLRITSSLLLMLLSTLFSLDSNGPLYRTAVGVAVRISVIARVISMCFLSLTRAITRIGVKWGLIF